MRKRTLLMKHHLLLLSSRRRKIRSCGVREINKLRKLKGEFACRVQQLHTDPEYHQQYLRMPKMDFDKLLEMVGPLIKKMDCHALPISTTERLVLTLRFVCMKISWRLAILELFPFELFCLWEKYSARAVICVDILQNSLNWNDTEKSTHKSLRLSFPVKYSLISTDHRTALASTKSMSLVVASSLHDFALTLVLRLVGDLTAFFGLFFFGLGGPIFRTNKRIQRKRKTDFR